MNSPVSREFDPRRAQGGFTIQTPTLPVPTADPITYQMTAIAKLDLDFLDVIPEVTYLVGGALRDLLLGRTPADIDLLVVGDIRRAAQHIAHRAGGRIVDIGKKGFTVKRIVSPETTIDITPLNHSTIEDDLLQRDFTINAMAYAVHSRALIDCTGGMRDMRQKIIRLVSTTALEKDPVRLVRAYRMAASFEFSIDAGTRRAISRRRQLVNTVAGERIWAELVKIFNTSQSGAVIRGMADSGLLTAIFPEMQATIGCTQNRHHQFDVFEHSLRAYEHVEDLLNEFDACFPAVAATARKMDLGSHSAMLKYASLLHDIGKPATRQVDEAGRVHFYGHAAKSAAIGAGISKRLRLSRHQRDVADTLIRHHLRPLFLFIASEKARLGKRGMVRFFNHCGSRTLPIVVHTMADIMAKQQVLQGRDAHFIAFCGRLMAAYVDYIDRQSAAGPLINGNDLISVLGLSPSPLFKHLLARVDERRLSGELSSRDQALAWVRSYLIPKSENQGQATANGNPEPPRAKPEA